MIYPVSKRLRVEEQLGSNNLQQSENVSPIVFEVSEGVSRQERQTLMKKFKREQRFCRRVYRRSVRMTWDAEIADDKENEDVVQGAPPRQPADPEVVAEAFENYLFERMERFDEDAASQLARFRSTLRVGS